MTSWVRRAATGFVLAGALVVGWALEALHLVSLIARCEAANPASVAVARRSGAMVHL